MKGHVLVVDQGTTSTRSIIFGPDAALVAMAQEEFPQVFPQPGWVEHDPESLWRTTLSTARQALLRAGVEPSALAGLGITNQRETTLVWSRTTGRPIHNAIVWQDRRTAPLCAELKERGCETLVSTRAGLLLDPYFSATKIAWILDNVPGARAEAERGELAFGTVDSFLVWRLTNGKTHLTDATNASRTLLFNIHSGAWDDDLLALFGIPRSMLPEVKDCAAEFGEAAAEHLGVAIPIRGIAGDQQAALIGQACFRPGMVKSTYGTGCFALVNTGDKAVASTHKLLTTIGYQFRGKRTYALEGSIFSAGATVQWLRDGLGILASGPGSWRNGGERRSPPRGLSRACLHRPWRSSLGQRRPRRDLWLDARRDPQRDRARGAGKRRLSDPRPHRRNARGRQRLVGGGFRVRHPDRRGHERERLDDAIPRRRGERTGRPSRDFGDDRARRWLPRGVAGGTLLRAG